MALDTTAMRGKYVIITYETGVSVVCPIKDLDGFLEGELSGLDVEMNPKTTLTFQLTPISDEEYTNLPEFTGP